MRISELTFNTEKRFAIATGMLRSDEPKQPSHGVPTNTHLAPQPALVMGPRQRTPSRIKQLFGVLGGSIYLISVE